MRFDLRLGKRRGEARDGFTGPLIVSQKSKVIGLRIFRENTRRNAIADCYNLNRGYVIAQLWRAGERRSRPRIAALNGIAKNPDRYPS